MKRTWAILFLLLVVLCTLSGCRQKTLDEVWKEEFDKADTTQLEKQIENDGGLKKYFP